MSELWAKELAMWEAIVDSSIPIWQEGGPWATPEERQKRVQHVALVVAHTVSLAPAEREVAAKLVKRVVS